MLKLLEMKKLPVLENPTRLSDLPSGMFRMTCSRKSFKNAIKKGRVRMNSQLAFTADFVVGGELIEIFEEAHRKTKPLIDIDLEVLFEDEYLAIVNKPAGILVSGNKKWTLENALSSNLKKSNQVDALEYPEPIHRLDYPTSGLLLIGKTKSMVIILNKYFEQRKIDKIYHAITIGEMRKEGCCETVIEDKKCKSYFKVISSIKSPKYNFLNFVQLMPHTGRQHQLRIQMAEMDNPIFGDLKYGKAGLISKGKGLFLHASSLCFIHPVHNSKLFIKKDLPKKFLKLFPKIGEVL